MEGEKKEMYEQIDEMSKQLSSSDQRSVIASLRFDILVKLFFK